MTHPNEKALRDSDEAVNKGDFEAFLAPFAEDVVLHVGGHSKLAGDVKGKQELLAKFQEFMGVLGDNAEYITHDILANDDHGVLIQEYKGTKNGKRLDARAVGIIHFTNGKITECWFFDEDPYTSDPFYDA